MNNDLISREVLKETARAKFGDDITSITLFKVFEELIDNVPTVTPSEIQAIMKDYLVCRCEWIRPQGKWINDMSVYLCGNCGMESKYKSPFCPYCGADMRGGAE